MLNILPPGQDDNGGLSNLTADIPGLSDLISTLLDDLVAETGLVPALSKEPHFDDQLNLYDALVRSPEALTDGELSDYFKDAPLLAPDAGDWESEITVTAGNRSVAIKRDRFGVPHIFGDSRPDALFGTGYVTGADRLFLLDVLRRAGRGGDQATDKVGGFKRRGIAYGVGDVDRGGPRLDRNLDHATEVIPLGPRRVHRRPLHVVAQVAGMADGFVDLVGHLIHGQVRNGAVQRRGADEGVDTVQPRVFHRLPAAVDVGQLCAGKAADHCVL